jgi:hypothetical protein
MQDVDETHRWNIEGGVHRRSHGHVDDVWYHVDIEDVDNMWT